MGTDLAHKSKFSPRWHHAEEERDTAILAAGVRASIEAAAAAAIVSIKSAADIGAPQLAVDDDAIDHLIDAADATNVKFSLSGLTASAGDTVTFSDTANHRVTVATDAADLTFWSDLSESGAGSFTATGANSSGNPGSAPLNAEIAPAVTVADGATVEIDGASAQSVTFAGTTGTLKIEHSLAFTGQVSGLTGSDALDLADVSYGANTTATFSGNAMAVR